MTNIAKNQNDVQEYSLMDLILLLHKNRKLFIWTIVVITILGVVFTFFSRSSEQYTYRQSVQLASYYLDGKQTLLQSNQQVISAINNFYLPRFIAQQHAQQPTFNEEQFLNKYDVQLSFDKTQISDQDASKMDSIYLEFKGNKSDLVVFQQASDSILQQIHQQEQPLLDSVVNLSKSNLQALQNEVPKLEKVGSLIESYSAATQNNNSQKSATSVSTRETYLSLISQSEAIQSVIQFKQNINEFNQKLVSLTPTTAAPIVAMSAKSKISSASMILLSFIIGIFIALLAVFVKVISAMVREKLKENK